LLQIIVIKNVMRKIIIYCFLVLFVGCEKEPFLTVTPSTVDFTAGGGKQTFSISCNNDWSAVLSGNSFLTLSATQGVEGVVDVALTALENKEGKDRSVTVTISSAGLSKIIEIEQAGAAPSISLDKTNVQTAVEGETFSLNVSTNGAPWTVGDVPEWMTLSPLSGTGSTSVNVSVKKNSMAVERATSVTFFAESATAQLNVKQSAAPPTISLSITEKKCRFSEDSVDVVVTTNGLDWKMDQTVDWVSFNKTTGSSGESLMINVEKNLSLEDRTGKIVFSSGSSTATLTVLQDSFYRAVEITYAYLRDPNTVGGCDAVVAYSNLSDKTIKYFIWRGYALNAVGDKVMCTVRDSYYFAGKDTGPYEPGETLCGGKWSAMIYNYSARKLVIYEISIEYMDGSIIVYEGEEEVNLLIKEGYNGERLPFDGWDAPPKPNGVVPVK
jgi:hypothetical protein